jgi:hypothetical protein
VPNVVGDACECIAGKYDSFNSHATPRDGSTHATRQLEIYCWSDGRRADSVKDPLNAIAAADLKWKSVDGAVNRRCIECPACLNCDWRPIESTFDLDVAISSSKLNGTLEEADNTTVQTQSGTDYSAAARLSSYPVVWDGVENSLMEVYRYKVNKGFSLASPNAIIDDRRVDLFECPGQNISCPGFELYGEVHNRSSCEETYTGFVCSSCEITDKSDFIKLDEQCIPCDGFNWVTFPSTFLINFLLVMFLLNKSTKVGYHTI